VVFPKAMWYSFSAKENDAAERDNSAPNSLKDYSVLEVSPRMTRGKLSRRPQLATHPLSQRPGGDAPIHAPGCRVGSSAHRKLAKAFGLTAPRPRYETRMAVDFADRKRQAYAASPTPLSYPRNGRRVKDMRTGRTVRRKVIRFVGLPIQRSVRKRAAAWAVNGPDASIGGKRATNSQGIPAPLPTARESAPFDGSLGKTGRHGMP